jgi:hypothetical protein
MKRLIAATLLAIFATGMASARKKNKKHDQVPAIFEHAKFVYVEAPEGAGRFGVVAGELQAISDVQASLQDWNRYTLAHRRRDADFVLVVIKGAIANGRGLTGVSIGPPIPPNSGANPGSNRNPGTPGQPSGGWGGAASPPGDVPSDTDRIRVYLVSGDGDLQGPVWTLQLDHGLDAPPVVLMQRLRTAVENAYPSQPAATQPGSPQTPATQPAAQPQPQQP